MTEIHRYFLSSGFRTSAYFFFCKYIVHKVFLNNELQWIYSEAERETEVRFPSLDLNYFSTNTYELLMIFE